MKIFGLYTRAAGNIKQQLEVGLFKLKQNIQLNQFHAPVHKA